MAETQTRERIYELLAGLVEYPTPDLPDQVAACVAALRRTHPRAARPLARFEQFAAGAALSALEELYTSTFDLTPVCYPYVGYQLFGDTYKRGAFLAQLNARYREHAFTAAAGELPDHLGVILRYLARTGDMELVTEGLIPTLKRMIDQLKGNPYRDVMRAILTALQSQ